MPGPRLTQEAIDEIGRLLEAGHTHRDVASILGVGLGTVSKFRAASHAPRQFESIVPLIEELIAERQSAQKPNFDAAAKALKSKPLSIEEIARSAGTSPEAAKQWLQEQEARGLNIHRQGNAVQIEKTTPQGMGPLVEIVSGPDNTFSFGLSADQHLGSKYSRLDVLNDLYDKFAEAKVQAVLNAGNWIDGEARFNKHDLVAHGMGNQLRYLVDNYPHRKGITTYAVSGDDHEGWYGQREGIDIGKWAQTEFEDADRNDWKHIGFVEGHIRLVNGNTGKSSVLTVMHPGGGSAYANSYQPQKIVESLEGGSKPAVLIIGHYHKLSVNNIRNVWVIQSGTTQDQTVFMKKKRIEAHIGGVLMSLVQDPDTGAIPRCRTDMIRYFDRGYYTQNRWSYDGPVNLPERGIG